VSKGGLPYGVGFTVKMESREKRAMPEYTAPGVYLEEIGAPPRPIEGVPTSTAGMVGETERGPLQPRLVTSWMEFAHWYGGYVDGVDPPPTPNIYLPYAVRGCFENGGRRLYVSRVVGSGSETAQAALPGESGDASIVACGPGAWGNRLVVTVTRKAERFCIRVMYRPNVLEEYEGLTADAMQPDFAPAVVNEVSRLIRIIGCSSPLVETTGQGVALQGGTSEPAGGADYGTGLSELAEIGEVALMAVPDEVVDKTLGTALVEQCERLRDRFAVLSEVEEQPDVSRIRPPVESSYGAFYYPKLRVPAPHTPDGAILVPACGHVLGVIARVDIERGVFKAPANEALRGLVRGDALQFQVSTHEQDILNPRGVNVIRDFRSARRGIRVWGARTMSSDSDVKYVNVRRLLIFLERSIDSGTQWVAFEPNTQPTWSMVRASVEAFLRKLWRDGALMGNRPEQAFFVKCDGSTMTQDDIDNGRLICLVGIAPARPAEFVILRFMQKTLENES